MSVALACHNLTYADSIRDFSCRIPAGSRTLVLTERDEVNTQFCRLVTGRCTPANGDLQVFDTPLGDLPEGKRQTLRSRIGVVPLKGGLVSNLKLWENITLPLLYHNGRITSEDEERAVSYLRQLGYSGNLMALPGHLSLYERRTAAFVRAVVQQAHLVLFCNVFDGLPSHERELLAGAILRYHTEQPDACSLFFAPTTDGVPQIPLDGTFSTLGNA